MKWLALILTAALVFAPRAAHAGPNPPGNNPDGSGSSAAERAATTEGAFGEKVEVVVRTATIFARLCRKDADKRLEAVDPTQPSKRALKGGPDADAARQAKVSFEATKSSLTTLCTTYSTGKLEFGAFADAGLAAAGLALDAAAMQGVLDDITLTLKEVARRVEAAPPDAKARAMADGLPSLRDLGGPQVSASLDFGSATLDLAAVALSGLAKLIVERARFEAVGWFLTELGRNLCATDGKEGERRKLANEMTRHVAPNLCQLAGKKQLWEYGAGAALWQSLQTAAASDLKGLPGVATGLLSLSLVADPTAAIGCEEKTAVRRKSGTHETVALGAFHGPRIAGSVGRPTARPAPGAGGAS